MYFCWFEGASPCNLFGFLEWFFVNLSWLFLSEILFWFHVLCLIYLDYFCLKFFSDFMFYVYINCWAPLSVLCLFSDVHFPLQVLHIPQFSEINSIHGESWVVFRMSISGEVTDSLPGTWNVICEATCNAGLLWLARAWSHDFCHDQLIEVLICLSLVGPRLVTWPVCWREFLEFPVRPLHIQHTDETFSY